MDLVVVDVLELVRASNDGRTASLSSFLPSPFAPVPLSFVSLPLQHRCPSSLVCSRPVLDMNAILTNVRRQTIDIGCTLPKNDVHRTLL